MSQYLRFFLLLSIACGLSAQIDKFRPDNDFFRINGGKSLLDAHNCYPYDGQWSDRLDRALRTGFPVAIEQDLGLWIDAATGNAVPKVTHNAQARAEDPSLDDYFFKNVEPLIAPEAKKKKSKAWPLIVLHFDFKNNDPRLLKAVKQMLAEHKDWLTFTNKAADDAALTPLTFRPLLVLTEDNDVQEQIFYKDLAVGEPMHIFGSGHTETAQFEKLDQQQRTHAYANAAPDTLLTKAATNYRRWWNSSWLVVEEGGQRKAEDWTTEDNQRLHRLIDHAHRMGYWVRFYTLDGFTPETNQGWGASYNFGSLAAAKVRWQAAIDADMDMIASDHYEDLHRLLKSAFPGITKQR